MQLPDEAVEYDYSALLATPADGWTPLEELRSKHLIAAEGLDAIRDGLIKARMAVAAERGSPEAPGRAAFVDLPERMLERHRRKGEASDLGRVIAAADRLRKEVDRVVVVGSGSATAAGRALFEALKSAHHNELPVKERLGSPRLYFAGDGLDTESLEELLSLLEVTCVDPDLREERWGLAALSAGVEPLETLAALRVVRRELARHAGGKPDHLKKLVLTVAGSSGRLRELSKAEGFADDEILTVPEGAGGRFSALTPAGLLPAALVGLDVAALLQGAAAMTRRFLEQPFERNPVLQYAAVNHLTAARGYPVRVLAVWSRKLEGLGHWYDGLSAEALGRQGRGAVTLTAVLPRDLSSRGRQFSEGARVASVNQLVVRTPRSTDPLKVGMADRNEDDLNALSRKSFPDMLDASIKGTSQALADAARPAATINLPVLSEYTLGQLLQMLMLAAVVEGRLSGIGPVSQHAEEPARRNGMKILREGGK